MRHWGEREKTASIPVFSEKRDTRHTRRAALGLQVQQARKAEEMKLLHTRPQPGHALRGNGRCPPALTQEAFYATRNLLTRQRAVLAAVRSEKKINLFSGRFGLRRLAGQRAVGARA